MTIDDENVTEEAATKSEVDAFAALVEAVKAINGDKRDELFRLAVYRRAYEDPALAPLLIEALSNEEDKLMASDIVFAVIEREQGLGCEAWLATLEGSRAQLSATRRADEWLLLKRIADEGEGFDAATVNVNDWTDWLQLRVAREGIHLKLLGMLTQQGNTKKTRRLATVRLEALRG